MGCYRNIQPRFVYQFASPNYYEPMEDWEVDKNSNVDVFAKAHVNVLDEVP
jgi:hypothetical protein